MFGKLFTSLSTFLFNEEWRRLRYLEKTTDEGPHVLPLSFHGWVAQRSTLFTLLWTRGMFCKDEKRLEVGRGREEKQRQT